MSFADQLTLHTRAAVAQVYDLVSSYAPSSSSTRTVRRNAARPVDKPAGITIAHEKSKDGKTINSVVILEQTEIAPDNVTYGTLKVQMKITYPVAVITSDHILDKVHELVEFATTNDTFTFTETNAAKLKNLES